MEAEARYTLVGAAALLLVAALVAAVLWLGNYGQLNDFMPYTIYFQNQRIDGLQVDSRVDMRGVAVGRVVSYELADYRTGNVPINRVRVVISVERRAPVFASTVAVITRNLVTGIAQISLVTPDENTTSLPETPAGEPYPLIAEGRSDLDEIAGKVERLGEMAGEIMGNLNRLLSPENRDAFTALLVNVSELSARLNARMDRLDEVLSGIELAATSIDNTGERVSTVAEDMGHNVDLLVADTRLMIERAGEAMGNVSHAMASLEEQGRTLTAQVDRTGAVLSDQLAAAVIDLRLSLQAAELTLERLQDPRSAVLGVNPSRLGPGEQE